MILNELYNLYLRLLEDGPDKVPRRGWSVEKVSWAIPLRTDGSIGQPIYLGGEEQGTRRRKAMMVPEHPSRSGTKPVSFFLCDTAGYLLGLEEKNGKRKREASCARHLELLEGCTGSAAEIVRAFFQHDTVKDYLSDEAAEAISQNDWCVLMLPDGTFAHEATELINAWEESLAHQSEGEQGQCAVTGEVARLARLFPQITGIPGAQGSGASLVSFNLQSFESYNRSQGYNASLSQDVAFGAGTALKYLFQDDRHRIRMGGMTVVFWADRKAPIEDAMVLQMLGGVPSQAEDGEALQQVEAALVSIKEGRPFSGIDTSTRYFVLGISPNAARLAVRFFETDTLGSIAANYAQYLEDIDIAGEPRLKGRKTVSLLQLLRQTALLSKDENLPAPLINPCFRALLRGSPFPLSLESLLLSRMRADKASNNLWDMRDRVSLMKACIVRRRRHLSLGKQNNEGEVTVSLNRENNDVGYLLGRLFAIMERAQQGALGDKVNATIRDKYMGSAAVTPARVYPTLMSLSQKHLSALKRDGDRGGLVNLLEREYQDTVNGLSGEGQPIPATLSSDDQMLFYIGYYHERVALWTPRSKKSDSNEHETTDKED